MWLRGVECQGVEDNLTLCQHHGPGRFLDCEAHNSTGVWCAGEADPYCLMDLQCAPSVVPEMIGRNSLPNITHWA